jgi:ATP-dependent Clp protease ATP-binding subunit ClpX
MFKWVKKQNTASEKALRCSFCNKPQDRVDRLIVNPTEMPTRAYICDECIRLCHSILKSERRNSSK